MPKSVEDDRKFLLVIGEYFPRAYDHFRAAVDLKSAVADKWRELLDSGFLDERTIVVNDGSGRLVVVAEWPEDAREVLTGKFSDFVNELWSCLDSLVIETVAMFSVRRRPRDPDRPRFFPMADSAQGLAALLGESCLDGILRTQYRIVVDAQPFWGTHEDPRIQCVRTGLGWLLDWRVRLDEGSQVGAWLTPVEPALHVGPPIEVQSIDVCAAGELVDERDVARFRLHGYEPGMGVDGQVGSYVDLGFADGFDPSGVDDTFEHRTGLVLEAVTRLMAVFAELARQVPGSRRLSTPFTDLGAWTDATASPRLWFADELSGLAAADFGVGIVRAVEHTILLVTTENGVFERTIPPATPLNSYVDRGDAAERAAQDAAATWGLPDFVMAPLVEQKGSGVREISDGSLSSVTRGWLCR